MLLYKAPSKDQNMSILFSVATLLEFLIMGVYVWGVYVWVHVCGLQVSVEARGHQIL